MKDGSFGDIAFSLFQGAMTIKQLIKSICIITGVCFVLGSFVQYMKYRRNPMEVRLGSVFFTLIMGLLLIAAAFIPFEG